LRYPLVGQSDRRQSQLASTSSQVESQAGAHVCASAGHANRYICCWLWLWPRDSGRGGV